MFNLSSLLETASIEIFNSGISHLSQLKLALVRVRSIVLAISKRDRKVSNFCGSFTNFINSGPIQSLIDANIMAVVTKNNTTALNASFNKRTRILSIFFCIACILLIQGFILPNFCNI